MDYYGKAKSGTEKCNSEFMPVNEVKKEYILRLW